MALIRFRDGFPYRWPALFVRGLALEHVNADGEVCLWLPGDESMQWVTLEGFLQRLEEWCADAATDFATEPHALDAHLYFQSRAGLATVDLHELLGPSAVDGTHGTLRGSLAHNGTVIQLKPLPTHPAALQQASDLPGHFFVRSGLRHPPRTLSEFREALLPSQRTIFDSAVVGPVEAGRARALALLVWSDGGEQNALLIAVRSSDEKLSASAVELAKSDPGTLALRAGPDQVLMASKRVCLFGAGAIGSTLALSLAAGGLGYLRVVDHDLLRPGNVVRHIGSRADVGRHKVDVIRLEVAQTAPWTTVSRARRKVEDPATMARAVDGFDLVVDATGDALFTDQLSRVASLQVVPMVSAALFRGGRLARVRRQREGVPSIYERWNNPGAYPTIPVGDDDLLGFELGCSAPTANASPVAVLTAAALGARVVIDALAARFDLPDEIVDVLDPIESPFDQRGWLTR